MKKSELKSLIREVIREELMIMLPEVVSNTMVNTLKEIASKNKSGLRGPVYKERKPVNAASTYSVKDPQASVPEDHSRSGQNVNTLMSILSETKPFTGSEIYGTNSILDASEEAMPSENIPMVGFDGRVVNESKPEVQTVVNVLENTNFADKLKKMEESAAKRRSNL